MAGCLAVLLAIALQGAPSVPDLPADPAAAHELALDAYRAGDLSSARGHWERALELLAEREDRSLDPAVLHYDLGNVAFREGRPLEAAARYGAALRHAPRWDDAWFNLELARSQAELPPADRGDLGATLRRVAGGLTPFEADLALLAAGLAWIAALFFEALRGGALARRLALGSTLLVVLALVPWTAARGRLARDPVQAVREDGATVRSEPRADAAQLALLEPGEVAEHVDDLPGWVRLETPSGERGWARADDVLRLRP